MDLNSLCYLGLGLISMILLIYICIKSDVRLALLTFIGMVGFGYIVEAVIYNFLSSYQYFPHIIKHEPVYDSALGAIASNALTLPVTATFLAVFRKNLLWVAFMIALYAGIEWLFLELHIYKHYWWKIYFTSIGLCFYFMFAKFLYHKLNGPLKGFLHTFCLYLIISPFSGSLHFIPIMFFSNRYYEFGLFTNQAKDTTAFASIFYLSASLVYVLIAKIHPFPLWVKYSVTGLCMYSATLILSHVGILHSLVWWDIWYYIALSLLCLLFTMYISKSLYKGPLTTRI
ncbi:hypothetical protein V7266_12980 [Neobacillus drentensis]|uniref:hypothetical protein n=1 Tax=Neobacillus drentensis TaxID=220684 RepID=UPI003000EB3B